MSRHTHSGRASQQWRGGPARFSEPPPRQHAATDLGPVLGGRRVLLHRPCCCTGLRHEHDPAVCPAEPVPEEES